MFSSSIYISGVYVRAETEGRQTLLRHRASMIADYEALHHIHFWKHEREPKYIYYFGESKTLEEWYHRRKHDQGAIYKDFEEKATFTKRTFKERDYDKHSILRYNDDNIEMRIKIIKNINNEVNENVDYLIKKLEDKNLIKEIEDVKIDLKANVEKLHNKLEKTFL